MSEVIKLSRTSIWTTVIVAIIIIAALVYGLYYAPNAAKQDKIEAYKKVAYESFLCQYNCPIVNATVENETRYIPDVNCINECSKEARAKNVTGTDLSDQDLLSDNLIADILAVRDSCIEGSYYNGDVVNYTIFLDCARPALLDLKQNYTYLN